MTIILNLTWAIVLLPAVGIAAGFLAETPRRAAQAGVAFTALALAVAAVVLAFRLTHVINVYENTQTFWDLQGTAPTATSAQTLAPEFGVFWGIRVDPLSVAFMAAVLFLSLVSQLHALVSMRGDEGFRRFFWVMGLLTFGVLALVSSPNLFQFWLGWEVAGVAAWMLATHRWQLPGTALAATRTFVLLRVADLVLLLGLVMTYVKFGASITNRPATNGQLVNDPFSFTQLTPTWHIGHLGAVVGVGARTLVVLAVIFVVAAAMRAAVGPLHLWLGGALDAPVAGLALIAVSALVPAGVLLARIYPLLLEAPHVLTALALLGAIAAAGGALLALAQRDLLRIGMFAVSSQAGMMLAAFGMGGYSPALFILFTAVALATVYFLAAGNLARGFRSRELADCAGGRGRMPRTTLALGGWALGISGLSLNTYSVLSATLRDALPNGGHVSRIAEAVVAAALLVATALTALYAFRVYFVVASGDPVRRRGFDVTRLREVDARLRVTAFVALGGAAVATLVGIPGLGSFTLGGRQIPGLTFSRFIFYGARRQDLGFDLLALAVALVVGVAGAVGARWLFAPRRQQPAAMTPGAVASGDGRPCRTDPVRAGGSGGARRTGHRRAHTRRPRGPASRAHPGRHGGHRQHPERGDGARPQLAHRPLDRGGHGRDGRAAGGGGARRHRALPGDHPVSASLDHLWSAAAALQGLPRLTAAVQPLIAAVTPSVSAAAVATPAPTVPFALPPTAVATPTPAPATTTPAASGLDLPSVLLSTVVFATTVAALIVLFLPERTAEQRSRVRSVALLASGVALVLTLFTLLTATGLGVAATPDQLHEENATWISHFAFAIHYHLSADGVTLSLLTLSTLVFTSVFLAAWKRQQRLRLYCGLLLVLETAVNGALCATDLVLFVMFFAMQAAPLYLLIRCFGGAGRERSAAHVAVAVLSSAALLVTGFLLLVVHSTAHSSDLVDLATAATRLSSPVATAGFWLVFAGFAIGFVVVPVHTWAIDATTAASSGVSAIFAGVVVRLSGYGMIRFALGLFPGPAQRFGSALMVLAVLSSVWGALLTLAQGTLRRMVAAVSVGQMSLVLLAVAAPNTISLDGAVLQLVAGGLSSALLLLLCGAIEGRTRNAPLDRLGGLAAQAPRLGGFWIFACLAAVGAPLLAGFSAELMLFTGVFGPHPYATVFVMAGTAVSTAALIWSAQRVFLGPAREEFARVRDTTALELGYLWPLVVFLVAFGVLAGRVVPVIGTGLTRIVAALGAPQ